MASASVGENQLQRIIRDLRDAVAELSKEHRELGEPITDDSSNLHKLSYKIEYLLQFDQKEKTTFLGNRKDYWDYFCDCLAKIKGANDGIRFVKSIPELKTSLGKGRAFIRYSLVHQRLADTLQQCLINKKVTSDWYYARSPFVKSHLTSDIINHLYELNEIQFDVAARGHDLDADWPTFARRTLGANSLSHLWKPPSRCSSINSLVSSYSQAPEFLPIPDFGHSLLGDLGELGEPSPCSIADDLRIELDQSELRQQELLVRVRELGNEAAELRGVVKDLQGQLLAAQSAPQRQEELSTAQPSSSQRKQEPEKAKQDWVEHLQASREASESHLQARLNIAENKNMELLSKLDGALSEKGQQTASYCDSAWKIQELLDKLKAAEGERLEARRESEDRALQAERLAQELKLQEDAVRESQEKLAELKASAQEERDTALKQAEELQASFSRLQGALSLKEKESGNLRAQLRDLQSSMEAREGQAEELKRRLQEEREEVQRRSSEQREALESQLQDLREQLGARGKELAVSSDRVKQLEEQTERLAGERQGLATGVAGVEGMAQDQVRRIEEYRAQCGSLMELNGKLLQTVKRSEESTREMAESRAAVEEQLAALRASEKHLKGRVEAAKLGVEERERMLLEDNQRLEDIVQKALIQKEASEAALQRLEQQNREMMEVQAAVKNQLASALEELGSVTTRASELEKNLVAAQMGQAELQARLRGTEVHLQDKAQRCEALQARAEGLKGRTGELDKEKGSTESTDTEKLSMEKIPIQQQHFSSSSSSEAQEAVSRLVLAEAQRDLNHREVLRLQVAVVELRAQLLVGAEESMKTQAMQEVTEASREDLRTLSEQLKAQVEEMNRRHVEELLHSREREEALGCERNAEAQARAGLATEVTAAKEELHTLKRRYEAMAMENGESREALHRANTETAELGVHVCQLTAENEEARMRWEGLSTRLQELEEEAAQEADRLNVSMMELRQENHSLLEQLHHGEGLPTAMLDQRGRLAKAQEEAKGLVEASQEEIQAVRFQLSSQAMNHQNQLQGVNEELQCVRSQLGMELEKVSLLESTLKQLETENQGYAKAIEDKDAQIATSESVIHQSEEEVRHLRGSLTRSEEGLAVAQRACQELSDSLRKAGVEKQSVDLRTSAELDDLYRTKINLEERLIELIREKDALWQKSDALEFEQKLRDEEQTEKEINHCLGCHSQFSWWLRKHNCRLCGRPFCYYCCSNTVSTQQGGSRERCCRDCYTQHSAVVERHPQEELANAPDTPFSPLPQPSRAMPSISDQSPKPDDGVFDIITEEEVNGVYDSDSLSFTTAYTPNRSQQGEPELNNSASAGDGTSEDTDDISASVQDAEICLLKSGELTLSVPLTVDDITEFCDDTSRELFIKSSCYSTIPIAVGYPGPTISWVFTSEPKSISFSVLYRENAETPLEQAKVLIPLTRCNSHKETIQGELKVRNAGEYTLVFDNSFSRFISKKVLYRLSVNKPVVYDGSD